MELDVKTLFLLFSAGNFFILLFFTAYMIIYRDGHEILLLFIFTKAIACIQWIFFANRGVMPDLYTIYIANLSNIFSMFLEIYCINYATRKFNIRHLFKLSIIPVIASGLFFILNNGIEYQRVILVSLIVMTFFLIGSLHLLFSKKVSKLQHFIGFLFLFVSIVFFFRASWASVSDNNAAIFTNHTLQVLSYIVHFLVSSPLAIALLLILREEDNQKLTELNKSKDRFYSIIAHDLRAPLNNLKQLGYFLNDEKEKQDQEHYHQMTQSVYKSARDASRLLDNLLKWASSNAGLMVFKPEPLPFKYMVDEILDFYESRAQDKEVVLINEITEDLVPYGDPEMVDTIIRNLINNALKFSQQKGSIRVLSTVSNKKFCTIGIEDKGIGMSNKIIENIMGSDHNQPRPGTADEKGTGLGLKLCKDFILQNKGTFWIESEEGKGSTFWFTLPVYKKKESPIRKKVNQ
ncbi:sensor histidine kinase [Reichenbachiella ulvae]|uniref:histidine kinase n=1 Tax=Reichenbachiella ulvae TaxID=2980104 RepID=A0ABT3CTM1_9BACT|nr:HAMP domain-containing sensor histidine kinase [Reichenbachiella ulvae]MCV9386874.1 HAMP domain-containing histidine kinase [Reichenbachiella ulvae]